MVFAYITLELFKKEKAVFVSTALTGSRRTLLNRTSEGGACHRVSEVRFYG